MSKAFIASFSVGMSPVARSGVLISGGGSIVNESLCARLLVSSIRFWSSSPSAFLSASPVATLPCQPAPCIDSAPQPLTVLATIAIGLAAFSNASNAFLIAVGLCPSITLTSKPNASSFAAVVSALAGVGVLAEHHSQLRARRVHGGDGVAF